MADFKTYADIYGDVCRAMGDLSQARLDEVKAVVNMVYLNEVCVCDELHPLYWLMDLIDDVKTKNEATLTAISKASAASVTSVGHGFVTGDIIQFGAITGMSEVSYRHFVVVRTTADAYTLKDLSGAVIDSSVFFAAGTAGKAYHRGITLSKAFRTIKSFNFKDYSIPLTPIGFEELEKNTGWYDTATESKPTRYLHKVYLDTAGNEYQRLLWFTLPDTVYYARIWGEKIPSRLSAVGDVPVLPARFHDVIVSGSVARLVQYGAVQIENAVIWPGLYKMQLQAIKDENREWWRKNTPDQRSGPYLI
jgi:hypothetical protein